MLALRYAALLALVVWIGGLAALGGFAAPSTFDVLSTQPDGGRGLAGAIFGETLRRFHRATYFCAAILFLSLLVRGILGPRPRRFAIRLGLLAVMTAVSLYIGMSIIPRVERLRQEIGVSPQSLPAADPRRAEFSRLHGWSNSLEMVPVLGGLLLLWWELKD
jgi:hypothetical protein